MALNFPSSPTANQIYVDVMTGLQYQYNSIYGAWRLKSNSVMIISDTMPTEGVGAGTLWYNTDLNELYVRYQDADSIQWVQTGAAGGSGGSYVTSTPYYLQFFSPGPLDSSTLMFRNISLLNYRIRINAAGSYALSNGAPTLTTCNLVIRKNGTQIGTINFAQGNTNGVFNIATAQTFTAGDRLEIISPVAIDTSFTDIAVSINGEKT